jgi:branched-chain amino acid transport system substrate-binding protein
VTAACGSSGSSGGSAAGDVLKITYIADTSGPGAFYGKDYVAGAKYAVDQVNAEGGVGGRTLDLEVVDSASNQQTAVGAMTKAVKSDSSAVMYALLSQNALAMAPIAQRSKVPFIVGQSGVDGITEAGDYVYRTTTAEGRFYEAMLSTLHDQGASSTAILYASDNPTAVTNATKTIPAIAKKLGMTITQTVPVKTADTDYSQPASRIADSSPDVIADLTFGPAVTTSIQALREAGFDGPLYGTSALGAGALKPAGAAAKDTYYPSVFIPSPKLPWASGTSFLSEYQKATGSAPSFSAAGGHDQVMLLVAALQEIGKGDVTHESVKDALASVAGKGFVGATGDPVRFVDRAAVTPGVLVRWDGEAETVAPDQPSPLLAAYTGRG